MSYRNLSESEIAWLSGLLEGEGCFYLHKQGNLRYPAFRLAMTDSDVVSRVAKMLGCQVYFSFARRDSWSNVYSIVLTGWPAIDLMNAIRSWMGERRGAKIDELVQSHSGTRKGLLATHCARGHQFTRENTIIQSNGRTCRQCRRESARKWREKNGCKN